MARVYLLLGAGEPPVATRPAFAWGAKLSPRREARKDPRRLEEGCLGHSVPHAQRSARASETQTAAAFVWFSQTLTHFEINMFEHVSPQDFSLIISNCSKCDNCVYQTYTDFHVFP